MEKQYIEELCVAMPDTPDVAYSGLLIGLGQQSRRGRGSTSDVKKQVLPPSPSTHTPEGGERQRKLHEQWAGK